MGDGRGASEGVGQQSPVGGAQQAFGGNRAGQLPVGRCQSPVGRARTVAAEQGMEVLRWLARRAEVIEAAAYQFRERQVHCE